jgi:hypothetical protein
MREFIRTNIRAIEWVLGALVILLPTVAWLSRVQLSDLTLYDIFPPLGLAAFGLMWVHFVMGAIRRYSGVATDGRDVFKTVSMGLVLALILLHPGLFWLALYLDGFGLPPQSYMEVYATQLGFLALGTLGLVIFLAYELKRFFGGRRWWKYIEWLQAVGMAAIFVHAIGLGNELTIDWVLLVWIFYGMTLALAVVYSRLIYNEKETSHGNEHS